jgi:hypothetical protein
LVKEARIFLRLNTHSSKPSKMVVKWEEDIPPVDTSRPSMGPG